MASGGKQQETIPKGILKQPSNFMLDNSGQRRKSHDMKWDEANIKATFHPPDKTYGHQKVDEPPTPYHFDPELQKAEATDKSKDSKAGSEDRAKNESFESKRRAHYNEYQAVKLARHLMEEEDKMEKKK